MTRVAFLFPGQGAQQVGMGRDLVREVPEAAELFDAASECVGVDVAQRCFRGPMSRLSLAEVLQPAITVVSLSCAVWMRRAGVEPVAAAGHSVGELSALAIAGSLSEVDAVRAAAVRGRVMQDAAAARPGEMIAVIGLDVEQVALEMAEICPRSEGGVANINAPQQVVVSGTAEAMRRARQRFATLGARLVRLNVSGAWHSELMAPAEAPFAEALDRLALRPPALPVPMNADGQLVEEPAAIRTALVSQLRAPVRWPAVMDALFSQGVDRFVELGPGKVLRGLLRLNAPDANGYEVYSAGDLRSLDRVSRVLLS